MRPSVWASTGAPGRTWRGWSCASRSRCGSSTSRPSTSPIPTRCAGPGARCAGRACSRSGSAERPTTVPDSLAIRAFSCTDVGPGSYGAQVSGHHDHSHGSIRAGARHKGRLAIAFGLVAAFMVVEVVAGFATRSLALLSDAGHMLTDVLGL